MAKKYVRTKKMNYIREKDDGSKSIALWQMEQGDNVTLTCREGKDGNKFVWSQEKEVSWNGSTFTATSYGYPVSLEDGSDALLFVGGEKSSKSYTDRKGTVRLTKLQKVIEEEFVPGKKIVLSCVSMNKEKDPLKAPTAYNFEPLHEDLSGL